MSINVECTVCRRRFDVPFQTAGNSATCPVCGATVRVPGSPAGSEQPTVTAVAVAPQSSKGQGLAITSLVMGILGMVPCFCMIPSVLALIFGIVALAKNTGGKGMAIAGTILGGLAFLLLPINLGLLLPAINAAREAARRANCASDLHQIGLSIDSYRQSHGGKYPPDLQTLVTDEHLNPRVLHCPTKADDAPEPDYVYAPPSVNAPPDTFLASDTVARHAGVRNVLRVDESVTAMPEQEFQQQLLKPQNRNFAAALAGVVGKPPANEPDQP